MCLCVYVREKEQYLGTSTMKRLRNDLGCWSREKKSMLIGKGNVAEFKYLGTTIANQMADQETQMGMAGPYTAETVRRHNQVSGIPKANGAVGHRGIHGE